MTMIVGVLRILIPLLILFIIIRLLWPRFKHYRQQRADRIEVDADVVSSIPHSPVIDKDEDGES